MGSTMSTAEKVVACCTRIAGALAGPEPKGLPAQNNGAVLAALEDPSVNSITLTTKKLSNKGVTPKKASTQTEAVFNSLPTELQSSVEGAVLKSCFETDDWQGRSAYTSLQVGGEMHFFYFVGEGYVKDGKDLVDVEVLHVVAPPEFTSEKLIAKMIKQTIVGFNPDTKKFALALGNL